MRSLYGVWPLTASMEVKNNYAYVITQGICNKFIDVHFFVGCMVSWPNCLFQNLTTMSLISKVARLILSCKLTVDSWFHLIKSYLIIYTNLMVFENQGLHYIHRPYCLFIDFLQYCYIRKLRKP